MSDLIRAMLGSKMPLPAPPLAVSAVIYGRQEPPGLLELDQKLRAAGGELELVRVDVGEEPRVGLLAARNELVICAEPDVWLDFAQRALRLLTHTEVDLVVSSKLLPGAKARVPFFARESRRFYHYLLRRTVGLGGTDTLGSKAFRRSRLLPVLEQCHTTGAAFSGELVIRAQRAGLDVREMAEQNARTCGLSSPELWRAPALFAALLKLNRTLGRKA